MKMVEGNFTKGGKKKIMPPGKRKKLDPEEIAVVKGWIDAGASAPREPAKIVRELVLPKIVPTVPPRRSIQAIAFASGPGLLAVGRYGEVELVSTETRAVVRTLQGHRGTVNALACSADGQQLAAAAGEPDLFGEARLWNVADGSLRQSFEGHKDALYAIAISPDGKVLATGSYDQKIKLWELETGKERQTLSAHNGAIFDLAFRPDGKILASASGDRTVKLWNVATGKRVETLSQPLKEQYAVTWSPDGQRLAAAGGDNRIRVWQVSDTAAETTNPLLFSRFAHEGAILNLIYSPDGKALLSSAEDRSIKLWDATQVSEKLVLETQPDVTPALAFLDGGKSFAAGRLDGTVEFYEGEKGQHLPPPAPELQAIEPRGLQRGNSGRFKLTGKHLAGITNVVTSTPQLTAVLLPERKKAEVIVEVTAGAQLARGGYGLSLAGPGGESPKLKIFVDDLPQVFQAQAGNAASLPVSFWGALDAPGQRDELRFEARAGQTVVLELAVKSVGSKITNGFLTLLDTGGAVLGSDSGFDGGDRFLAFKVPVDGCYLARVADQMLGASKEHFYRLSVGALPYVTGV
ncbi:MAG TPA: WD40 repeat domain-containing protein, partial [Candidatus Binatia bacterium]|nr:WD40 repeat domain-containing protein [Candidatus Binatia bacterium]